MSISRTIFLLLSLTVSTLLGSAYSVSALDGQCGSSDGQRFITAPTSNLCTAGTPSAVSGTGPWTWTCAGTEGGSTAACSADLLTFAVISFVTSGNGIVTCTTPVSYGSRSTCAISPATGYRLDTLTDNGTDVRNQVSGSAYTIPVVTSAHAVTATFISSNDVLFPLHADFGPAGLWMHNGTAWSQLSPSNPESMVAAGSLLYGDFGPAGLWMHKDGIGWSQLSPSNPESMVVPF